MISNNENEMRTYKGGAVRATDNSKGRFDLAPLTIMNKIYSIDNLLVVEDHMVTTLEYIGKYQDCGCVNDLWRAIYRFKEECEWSNEKILLEVAKRFGEGEEKYPADVIDGKIVPNVYKGIPMWSFIDSGTRHYVKWLAKMNDEDHDAAVFWNLFMAIWTYENKPELLDINHESYNPKLKK